MTTTIVPGIGQGAVFTQQGAGASPGYAAIDVRRSDSVGLQEGVYNGTDFMVVQRGAGANMSIDVGMPAGGGAEIQGDSVNGQGLYFVPVHSTTINEAIATADATNPRIDQVILEVLDNVHDASGLNLARTRVLTGTPTAGATLTNRNGAAALPGSALLLADVLVGAAVGSITNAVIRDRRKWARGAFVRIILTAGGNKTTSSTTLVAIDATNLAPRIECSGVPLRVSLHGTHSASAAGTQGYGIFLDGTPTDGITTGGWLAVAVSGGAQSCPPTMYTVPAAGSHVVAPAWLSTAGTAVTLLVSTTQGPLTLVVEELVRQNLANNSVTTG